MVGRPTERSAAQALGVEPRLTHARGHPGALRVGHRDPSPPDGGGRVNVAAAVRRQVNGTNEVDAWGMDHDVAALARSLAVLRWDITVGGDQHVPSDGPALLVANRRVLAATPLLVAAAVGRATGRAVRFAGITDIAPHRPRAAAGRGASSPGRTRWPACSGRASFPRCGASPTSASVIESVRRPTPYLAAALDVRRADPARSGDRGTTGPPGAARDRPGDRTAPSARTVGPRRAGGRCARRHPAHGRRGQPTVLARARMTRAI